MYDDLIDSVLNATIDHAEGNQMWNICSVLASVMQFPVIASENNGLPPLAVR